MRPLGEKPCPDCDQLAANVKAMCEGAAVLQARAEQAEKDRFDVLKERDRYKAALEKIRDFGPNSGKPDTGHGTAPWVELALDPQKAVEIAEEALALPPDSGGKDTRFETVDTCDEYSDSASYGKTPTCLYCGRSKEAHTRKP